MINSSTPKQGSQHVSYDPDVASRIIFDARNKIILKLMQKLDINNKTKILDVGCGRGDMLQLLFREGYTNLYGLDADSSCTEKASKFGTIFNRPIEDLDKLLPEQHFEVLICSHVLEHVSNPLFVLKLMVSKVSKYVFLVVPNTLSVNNIIRTIFMSRPPVNKGHLQAWDTAHFLNLIQKAHLKPISKTKTENVSFFPYRFFEKILGEKVILWIRRIDFLGFFLLPKVFPRFGTSIISVCKKS